MKSENNKKVFKKLKESDRNEKIELRCCLTKNRKYVVIVSSSIVLKIHIKKYQQAAVELKSEDYILTIFPNFHF